MHPRKSLYLSIVAVTLSFCAMPAVGAGTNLWTIMSQGSPSWLNNIWRTNSAGLGNSFTPVAGNTYVMTSNGVPMGGATGSTANTRVRPPTTGTATFPGDSLTMLTQTDIRWKTGAAGNAMNFPGAGGNPGLILKGGMLNGGDDGTFVITGLIRVDARSYISQGANGAGGGISQNRAVNFTGQLTGTGDLVFMNGGTTIPQLISASNTFSGQWILQCGWLVSTTNNAFGTNNIIVDPNYVGYLADMSTGANPANSPAGPALFEPRATVNSAGTLILTNGGRVFLHQELCFTAVRIHDAGLNVISNLSAGTHFYPELRANFPNVFDAGGSGAIVVQPFGTPPPLPPALVQPPINVYAYADGIARFSVVAADNGFPPLAYQWRSNGVNITSSRFFGQTNSTLVLSNPTPAEASATYDVVVNNASFPTTSSIVSLTIVAPSGEAYEAAVRAAKPVAFYQLNELGNPATNSSPAYDFAGGYYGFYGIGAQNGFFGITGPQTSDGALTGFGDGNLAMLTQLAQANNRMTPLPWNLNSNVVTMMAWVNPSSAQNANEAIIFCRGGSTVAGLCYSTGASLGYNWNNEPDTYSWNSGITPTPGQWSLVGLVVTPTVATVYVLSTNSGTLTLQAAQHVYNHAVLGFEVGAFIGDDSAQTAGQRSFNGKIDDVAIFNRALSQGELLGLFSAASATTGYAPQIAVQPVALSVFQGQTVQFTGLAVGSDPLTYQWQSASAGSGGPYANVSGGKFSGATTPALTIANADFTEALDYIVVASNGSGSTTSTVANLFINATNGSAINVTMTVQEPAGNDWDIGAVTPGGNTNWSDLNPASYSAAQSPGNTYELLPGSRLRSPDSTGTSGNLNSTFPGRQLTVDGDGIWNVNPGAAATTAELRFKQHTYGSANGVVNIPKLVMNGGQVDLGNDGGPLILNGEIDILANTSFNNDSGNDRGYVVNSFLTGSSPIEYHGYNAAYQTNFVNNLNIAGTSNTFSGIWSVVTGTLLGTGNKGLGTNHIFVGTNGAVETTYNITNSNAYLVINAGKMFLHQTDVFRSVVVNGTGLAPGSYTFSALNTSFPTNFPLTWLARSGSTFSNASGSILVLSNSGPVITAQPLSRTNRGQQTASFNVAAAGANPLRYQWMAGAVGSGTYTNLISAPNVSGSVTNTTLTITNLAAANQADYVVVITNQFGAVTSLVARLTVLDPPFITLQPLSQTNSGTLTANFFVSALGDLPLSYQWQAAAIGSGGPYTNVNFGPKVTGVNATNLTISLLAISNSADYIVVVANSFGSATSSVARLTVIDPLLTQDATPASTSSRVQGDNMTWTVGVLGTPPLISQWQGGASASGIFTNMINGPGISGATATSLSINSVDFGDAGDYRYIVNNVGGSVTSSVVSLTVSASSPAQPYTLNFDLGPGPLPIQQVAGLDWNTLNNWNPGGDSAANTAPAQPGSSYTVVEGARLRSPVGLTNAVFPGDVYTPITVFVNGNGIFTNNPPGDYTNGAPGTMVGEIRFKHFVNADSSGASLASVFFKKLVMNGGQLDNGDNTTNGFAIRGEMDILANTPIYADTASAQARCFRIESWLTGNAGGGANGIEWHDFDSSFSPFGGLTIAGTSNTYSGMWHVVTGVLLGSGANSLGTNSITVDNGAALETSYNLNTPTANLTLNGQMFLHNSDTFRSVTIGSYQVPAGTYTYAQWAASFPGNFPATWTKQRDSAVSSASGSITVLTGPSIGSVSNSVAVSGSNLVISGTGGLPNGKFYVLSSANLAVPKTSWAKSGPFPFDGVGAYSVNAAITNNPAQQFFMLQQIVP